MKKLILASASPRRKEILGRYFEFEVSPSDKESDGAGAPEELAVKKAIEKAEDVFSREWKDSVVLGADTVVSYGGKIFGKPKDEAEAESFLRTFSGKKHVVVTGYAVLTEGKRETGFVTTEVEFNELNDETIKNYLASGLWQGKAGGYGIQDGYGLIKGYNGDYDNVVGLPVFAVKDIIKEFLK